MVQLAVLSPFKEFEKWSGEKYPIYDDLMNGLPAFYDSKINCINRWLPALADTLDQSEEQKKEMVMDSWYLASSFNEFGKTGFTWRQKSPQTRTGFY